MNVLELDRVNVGVGLLEGQLGNNPAVRHWASELIGESLLEAGGLNSFMDMTGIPRERLWYGGMRILQSYHADERIFGALDENRIQDTLKDVALISMAHEYPHLSKEEAERRLEAEVHALKYNFAPWQDGSSRTITQKAKEEIAIDVLIRRTLWEVNNSLSTSGK